ncbi:cation-transporting P-type ATPase [Caballeronia sp. SL2Y3]|uniref:cation-translocating P-type ATPase n=1 Tax=Caballeronia sp. SL2Y3 TaxID=2878151 RepID=UPI001FD063BA|nr:cation-transporting P-type ATPase [Caballeronia sp. SL2Y3]
MTEIATGPWHERTSEDVALAFASHAHNGLSRDEAARRLSRHGPNETIRERPRSLLSLIGAQFRDYMNIVLLVAACIAAATGDAQEALAIAALVLVNGAIGLMQTVRAEHAMAELRKLGASRATVVRDGERLTVPAAEVVPGDLAFLEAGASVPADIRLVESIQLRTDESALTGESLAVDKSADPIADEHAPLAERRDMAYMGTSIACGRGSGIVVATGMDTELGKIVALLGRIEPPRTPLQQRLAAFGRQLGIAIALTCVAIFAMGVARGEAVSLMLLTSVSLAVAAIPEALPTVLTVMLALGARNLARRRALVRNLAAIETLGSVSHVCTDKTGTLTLNDMRVVELGLPDGSCIAFTHGVAHSLGPDARSLPRSLLCAAALACGEEAGERDADTGKWLGDPTEVAIWRAAREAGLDAHGFDEALLQAGERSIELPFDSTRMRMTVVYRTSSGWTAYMKGAPEAVLPRCDATFGDSTGSLDRAMQLAIAARMAADGQRLIAVSKREVKAHADMDSTAAWIETGHVFLGFLGMQDPPRPGAPQAVDMCRRAGIVPVMMTGDHPLTASAIARSLGIMSQGQSLVTGPELDALSQDELVRRIESVSVFARLDPAQKIRIVEALQTRGRCVAVTGDGINDAPALSRADIGVAMGKGGTDVAREAADVVLLDDDYGTLVAGIEEGRRIYENVTKFIRYALTGNAAELLVIAAGPLLGLPMPLLPIQILWINLVTDGLPGLALAAEPAEPDIMRRAPRPPRESLFAGGMWQRIVGVSLAISLLTLGTEACALAAGQAQWQTMAFTVLSLSQMGLVLGIRSARRSVFELGLCSNRALAGAVCVTVALQIAAIYVPFFNDMLHTTPLDAWQLAVSLAVSSVVLALVEFEKYLARHHLFRKRAGRTSRHDARL